MSSLLSQAFQNAKSENRPALLTYTVAGDNTKKKSLEILKSISNYADICELGFPHNTPIADGGQIQTSAYRAIKNGIKINDVFSIAKDFKKSKKVKSASKKEIHSMTNLCIQNLDEINFFKPKEKKPIMLENLRNIFYRMELSSKETRILASVFASLGKKR